MLLAGSVFGQLQEWKQIVYANQKDDFRTICEKVEAYFESHEEEEKLREHHEEAEEEGSSYNHFLQWKYFMQFRLTEDGHLPAPATVMNAFADENARQKIHRSTDCPWTFIDQVENDGGYWGIGRTTCVSFHPSNDQIYYVCSPGGGIWKTTDGGQHYNAADDGLPYGATANLLINPTDPNVLYVSNGDHSGWWTTSTGVYKSTDGGQSWLPTTLVFNLDNTAIYEMQMSPTDPNVIFAATTNGLYRTTDGGLNWTIARAGGHSSVRFQPGNGNVVYAAFNDYWGVSQVYKSTDGGTTWNAITTYTWNYNFIKLATTQQDPDRLLVSCDYAGNRPLFQSSDAGATFSTLTDTPENSIIAYSPNDVNTLYCGYVVAYRSTDGGTTWDQITNWYNDGQHTEIHADFHYVGYSNNASHIYFCNDGGMYRLNETTDTWTDLSNGLKIGQFYRIANAGNNDVFMIGGTQDNGGRKRLVSGEWVNANGGDGMEVAIRPDDFDTYYTTYINGTGLQRTTDGGNTTTDIHANIPGTTNGQWVTPYELDPNNSDVIVAAYDNIFRSTDQGDTWDMIGTNTIAAGEGFTDMEIAPSNSLVIYAAYQDVLFKTTNGGTTWTTSNLPGNAPISRIEVHPDDASKIWVSRGNYSNNTKVTYSPDGGTTWTNYSTGLPNVPCNVVIYEPNSPGRLYAGNDYGVYYRDSTMSSWQPFGTDLPVTFVNDLKFVPTAHKLRAGTFGRGVWEIDLCASSSAGMFEQTLSSDYAVIYPNPSKGDIWVVQKTVHPVERIALTDMAGKKVAFSSEVSGDVTTLHLKVAAGTYVLNYVVNGRNFSQKITVE